MPGEVKIRHVIIVTCKQVSEALQYQKNAIDIVKKWSVVLVVLVVSQTHITHAMADVC